MKMENPGNLILVIFGASGDLTSRKLIPALFSLKTQEKNEREYYFFFRR
jgi:glucose-6-phosphate 1-dehydrogenase